MASHAGNVSLIGNSSSYRRAPIQTQLLVLFSRDVQKIDILIVFVCSTQETLFQDLYQPECVLEVC